jgi:hypothetical protein
MTAVGVQEEETELGQSVGETMALLVSSEDRTDTTRRSDVTHRSERHVSDKKTNKIMFWRTMVLIFVLLTIGMMVSTGTNTTSYTSNDKEKSYKKLHLELQGKKKTKSSKHDKDKDDDYCNDGEYSKRTLKLAYELPFASLFRNTQHQRKYEASSVTVVGEDVYAVCDSSWAIAKFSKIP